MMKIIDNTFNPKNNFLLLEKICTLEKKINGKIGFVETEEQYEWPHKWNQSTITYAVIVKSKDAGIFSKQRRAVGLALTTWGLYIPIKFKRVKKTSNPDIKIFFVDDLEISAVPGIPQNILQYAQKRLKDNPRILAFAWFPHTTNQGVVVFNDVRYNWDVKDYYKNTVHYYNFIHVLIHELGHTLGMSHATINNGDDIMDPIYNNKTALSDYDIIRIRKKYGIRIFSRWSHFGRLRRFLTYRKKNLW